MMGRVVNLVHSCDYMHNTQIHLNSYVFEKDDLYLIYSEEIKDHMIGVKKHTIKDLFSSIAIWMRINQYRCDVNFYKVFENEKWLFLWELIYTGESRSGSIKEGLVVEVKKYWNIISKQEISEETFIYLYKKHISHENIYLRTKQYQIQMITGYTENKIEDCLPF